MGESFEETRKKKYRKGLGSRREKVGECWSLVENLKGGRCWS